MRWFCPAPSEEAARNGMLARIDTWWRELQAKLPSVEAMFAGQPLPDLAEWMETHLGALDRRIMWEFGPGLRTKRCLVLTPEMRRFLRPLVDEILRRAPRMDGWEFRGYRLPDSEQNALATVQQRTGTDVTGHHVSLARGRGGMIDFTVVPRRRGWNPFRGTPAVSDGAAFVLAESLLGEEVLDNWMGILEVGQAEGMPLAWVHKAARQMIDEHKATLPPVPRSTLAADAQYAAVKLEPVPSDDYVGRLDLAIATTSDVALFEATHPCNRFASERFSRVGERFGYLKIDGLGIGTEQPVERRTRYEDAINDALRPIRGGVIGSGTGLRYGYLDLAMVDVAGSIERLRATLQPLGVVERSWLLFYDAALGAEWVSMWQDGPAPPMDEDGLVST